MSLMQKVILTLLLWAGTIGMGVMLASLGRPYHAFVFGIHTLFAIAAVVMTFVLIRSYSKFSEPDTLTSFFLFVIGVSVVALFVTGTLLSFGFETQGAIKLIHTITTVILVVSAIVVFGLTRRKSQ